MIVKELKLMALSKGIKIHQYLDDWLIRAQSQREDLLNTKTIMNLTEYLEWIVNWENSVDTDSLRCSPLWATSTNL